jgi:endonuclease/exonuclease/phosphatase (EEP) superfamily protein YafD
MWREMVSGEQNPLLFQTRRLISFLERDFGVDFKDEPVLVIGDFNFPKSLLGVETRGHEVLHEKGLFEAFRGAPDTFPARSSNEFGKGPFKYGRVKLDHAFVSPGVTITAAEVLPLKGSDHYPIYVVLNH